MISVNIIVVKLETVTADTPTLFIHHYYYSSMGMRHASLFLFSWRANLTHDELCRLGLPGSALTANDTHLVLLALHHGVVRRGCNSEDVRR